MSLSSGEVGMKVGSLYRADNVSIKGRGMYQAGKSIQS